MIFTLEILPAKEGDCLLLHWGTTADPKLAVIDGGPGRVYENTLSKRLEKIRANRGIPQLVIDVTMVSHIDADHITGIEKLLKALQKEVENNLSPDERKLAIRRLWHNAFDDIIGNRTDALYKQMQASITASAEDETQGPKVREAIEKAAKVRLNLNAEKARHLAHDIALVLASHRQGRTLRDAHAVLRNNDAAMPRLNSPFASASGGATLIMTGAGDPVATVSSLKFRAIGPAKPEIDKLQEEFDAFLEQSGLSAEAMLAGYTDDSVPNLSSIVTLVESGDKRILLTGDARGDHILEGLEAAGLLADEPLQLDVLKVPHHGSSHNIAIEFFERVVAKTYVFSADGKYGNPDRETLEWLTEARGKDAEYDIVLTYRPAEIDAVHKEWLAARNKPWKPAKLSLVGLFAEREAEGYRFRLHDGAPHLIELGTDKIDW